MGRREEVAEVICAPGGDCIGSISKQLNDDVTLNAWVGTQLDLDEGRKGVLVQKEVIDAPQPWPAFYCRETRFAGYKEPTARPGGIPIWLPG